MNKKELLLLLADVPDDAEVIISSDAEGNSYSPLCSHKYPAKYVPNTTWSGEIYAPEDSEEDEYWKDEKTAVNAVVLYPTN
jgi:hypothetical protein